MMFSTVHAVALLFVGAVHLACFRNFSQEHIENLAESNPEWITVRNNAGYSPLQILSKNGRLEEYVWCLLLSC